MKRDTLARYFGRLVLAALPLAGGCCHDSPKDIQVSVASLNLPDLGGSSDYYYVGCGPTCGDGYDACYVTSIDGDKASIHCEPHWCTPSGRRPAGLAAPQIEAANQAGALFAVAAHLEGASVHAFARLERELSAHGAPTRLTKAASAAARDEVRHHRVMRRLAGRYGAKVPRPRVARLPVRSLMEIAVENAVEGCVRETWGALIASFQARAAADPEVRSDMEAIARDEIRHAELAQAVDRWIGPRLTAPQRRQIEQEKRRAVAELAGEVANEASPSLRRIVGLPDRAQARFLFDSLYRNVG